ISSITGRLPSPSMDSGGVVPGLLMSFCFLVGLPGNIAVIILKPKFQQLSSMTQSLMLNLAVSDLLVMLTVPLWVYTVFYGWIFGMVACKIIRYYMYCCVYASLLTIVTLSLQRYMLVVHQQFCNQTKMRLILVLLWLVALILSIPALVVNQLTLNQELVQCKNMYSSRAQKMAILLPECIVGFTSLFIITFSYIQLYRKVKQTPFFNNPQTSRLVTSIIIVFICLWSPYSIADVLRVSATVLQNERLEKVFENVQDITGAIIYLNSCLNPLLYTFNSHICKCGRQMTLFTTQPGCFVTNVFHNCCINS
uniref:G-protein coupled receptors family 1 profile domain-containing protein n=1 Tax=Oryzias sinensis TaxID=183150 RepID=A0A8C7YPS6_9TELE